MKKLVSVLLVLVMAFTIAMPATAIDLRRDGSDIPVVAIFGDGEPLYDGEGNKVFHFREIISTIGASAKDSLVESLVYMTKPFLVEGLLHDEWDNFYAVLEREMGRIFAATRYDNNGEKCNDTDIHPDRRQTMADNVSRDTKALNGSYYVYDYQFWYDWRQDPLKTADEFHQYIQDIKEVTGAPKVSIIARCLGTSVVVAYLAKYGTDNIHGVSFNGSVAAGGEIISELISGKFDLDLNAIRRMLADFDDDGNMNLGGFLLATIDLLAKTAKATGIELEETKLYKKIGQGVFAAGSRATFFTWPGYWALVTKEDYPAALNYIFGDENSELRKEYAGLITKINNYQSIVVNNMTNILEGLKTKGIKVGVIAKYGYQIAPVIESKDAVGDQFASIKRASFGATTSDIYSTLSEEYIAQRVAEGKGRYISPDKQIDASTCIFPDSTWFTKGITHSEWTAFETALLFQVITADKQLTIDDFDCTQFILYDNKTDTAYPMTEENCHIEPWNLNDKYDRPQSFMDKIAALFNSLINWVKELMKFAGEKLGSATNK